jgi:O-antigen/teichoic acid export membrane protein
MSEPQFEPPGPHAGRVRARQAGILVFGKVLSTLADALVPIVAVRLLDKTQVGVLSGVMVTYATLSLILTTGFPAALFHFLPTRDQPQRAAIARRFARVLALMGMGLGLLLLSAGGLSQVALLHDAVSAFEPEALALIAGLALYPLGELPVRLLPNLLVIEGRPRGAAAVAVFNALGISLSTLLPIALGFGLKHVFWSLSGFGLIQALATTVLLSWLYHGVAKVPSPVSRRTIFRFSLPLGLTDIVSMLNNRLDRYLVGLSFPAARLAEYQVGAWQVPVVNEVPYAVGRVLASDMVRLFANGRPREAIALWRASIRKVALLVVPLSCVFLIAAEETMELLFTAEYSASANVFRCYSALLLGRVAAFGTVIVSAGKPSYVLQAAVFSILSNVALSLPLLYWFGFIGPALGAACAFIPMVWFYCFCIARATGLRTREIFPFLSYVRVLSLGIIASLPAVAFKLSVELHPALKLVGIALLVLLCFGALGTLTRQISSEDWRFVRGRLGGR